MSNAVSSGLAGILNALLALTVGDVADAQNTLSVPDECSPLLTVHKESCTSSLIFDCEGERLVLDYERGELQQQARYDADWSLLEYTHFNEQAPVLKMTAKDGSSFSMTRLLEEGTMKTSGTVVLSTGVIKEREYKVSGTASLTGASKTLDGIDYLKARISRDLVLSPEVPGIFFVIDALIDPESNLMIEESWQRTAFGGKPKVFDQEVEAVYSEEADLFLSVQPELGCN